MLYIFHVDAGVMVTFDMNLTLQNVMSLKFAIEKKLKIPADMIVLLVSGGEVLQPENLVSSYGAGTDSSPIFLFTKPSVKEQLKQSSQYSVNYLSPIEELSTGTEWCSNTGPGSEIKTLGELKSDVEMCCNLPPAISTVTTCAKVAHQFSDHAQSVGRSCEQLVHDQHLQHQGWAAVVANLEDIYNEFCERSKNFKETFKKHKLKREHYHEQMEILNAVLESLGKIPMLPGLQLNAEAHRFSAFDVFEEGNLERACAQTSERESTSSDNKAYQDFGVEAFKLSEEEVFEEKEKNEYKMSVAGSSEALQESEEGVTFKTHCSETKESTLLHWILAQGNKDALQDILDYCQKGINLAETIEYYGYDPVGTPHGTYLMKILKIDADPLKERENELRSILEYANMRGLKQIKGIEDRLYGLDQLRNDVKKLVKDQHDQAAALLQNRDRVSTTCDHSVLPTLVQSHRCQLEKLLKNHEKLVDIKRRIAKSKEELSHILKARLEAVFTIENSMSVQDAHQMLSFQCFNRLARYFEIVDQLHRAPAMFIRAVHEVTRRRTFSDAYMQWAITMADNLLKIHSEEILRRQEFNTHFDGHFLRSLFPGLADLPPTFATEAPLLFDSRLPKLLNTDAEYVSNIFPELAKDVPLYDMEVVVKYFRQQMSVLQHEDKGVDAQTDIDRVLVLEFEKLGFQPGKQKNDVCTSCAPDTLAVSTITEVRNTLPVILESPPNKRKSDEFESSGSYIEESWPSSLEWGRDTQENMDTHKLNMEKLTQFLINLHELCKWNIVFFKQELLHLTNLIEDQKKYVARQCLEIAAICERSNEQIAISFREETQRLTVDHELELSDMKKVIRNKDEIIDNMKNDVDQVKQEFEREKQQLLSEHENTRQLLSKVEQGIKDLEKKLEEAEVIKEKEKRELQDQMHKDYKAELESMRSRYRLVAVANNMDRSPSESSLEKIERTDVIEINSHNAIIMQTKENAEVEKEEAVRQAVEKCEKDWQLKMEEKIKGLVETQETEKQVTLRDATRRLIAEKDRQIETLRERELNLIRECTKYKETIHQLADPETNDYDSLIKTQLATLENEKAMLTQQVKELKKELEVRAEQDKKEGGDSENTQSSSSSKTEAGRRNRRSHTPVGLEAGTISLSSCLPGNCVLIMWDSSHENYTVLQESTVMYFVHSDCLQSMGLSTVNNESERRLCTIGVVESKEFCYAKKSANRYRMPRASKFYRVRVKPSREHQSAPSCCAHRHSRPQDLLKPLPLYKYSDRPVKKWLTYLHAPDIQKSVDISQLPSTTTEEASAVCEVVTGTLINLESPGARPSTVEENPTSEDQLDSIEASSEWHTARMQVSAISTATDMESSVGRVRTLSDVEVIGSVMDVLPSNIARFIDSEIAEEATP